MFPDTLMLVQKAEYSWAGSRQDTVAFHKKHPVQLVDGDYDIFGDGSLVLLFTPAHTPGHQSLLVRLPLTGPVILSGDVVHFQTSFEHRYVPSNNWSKEASLQSMNKIAAILFDINMPNYASAIVTTDEFLQSVAAKQDEAKTAA